MVEGDVLKGVTKSRGIGYAIVPLFFEEMP